MFRTVRRFLWHYWQLSIAVIAALIALGFQLIGPKLPVHWLLGTVSLGLTIPLLVGMYDDLRSGKYGIDILAATAIVTSVLLHQYWAAIVIVVMLTGGEALEAYAERRAHAELDSLLASAPTKAHVLRGRKEVDIDADDIQVGDKFVIKPGEVVPVDATIIDGQASFNEASLTGESLPQSRASGQQILSGSINIDGVITAKALHTAQASQYQQIVRLVRSAQSSQSPFVRLADRYSIPFTITAFVIAGAAWVIGHHAIRFLEVIVVATPCPLLLAAPIALVSGMSRASKYGIIVRTGSALEKLAEAETFAFDKTGTLTRGELQVAKVQAFKPFTSDNLLALAAGVEQNSIHVLAQALVTAAAKNGLRLGQARHVSEIPGQGVSARVKGVEVLVGRRSLLEKHGVDVPKALVEVAQTTVYVASDGQLAGIIALEDQIRPDAKKTLASISKGGVKRLLMVTGDNQAAAQKIAKELGITEVKADALPADKLHVIEAIKERPVAFVGDGVNDAPVLTVSDVGIALGARGSTAASESADIIIMTDDFSLVARSLAIARRTFAIARQSILVGIFISIGLMAVFATGHFPPLLGAVLQEVVDVVVIFNALRAHTGKIEL